MILTAYAFHDSKALAFTAPFFMAADGAAIRMAIDAASDRQSLVGRHPADFTLYRIGTFNDETATLESHPPFSLGLVSAMLAAEMNQVQTTQSMQ